MQQQFRQYLKNLEAEIDMIRDEVNRAHSKGVIDNDFYSELTRGVNGRKLMLDNISREYERTHKIWE